MVSKGDSSSAWLNLGYELFSEEGHEGLQVERLSRILGKNKSGFYHFFGDKDNFLERLMENHLKREEDLLSAFVKIDDFNPRFLQYMVENKQTILFQTQLVKNRDMRLFQDTFAKVNGLIENAVMPIWMSYLGVPHDVALKYWGVIRDTFYARVTPKSFNLDWLSSFASEVKAILVDAQNEGNSK